MRLAEDRGAYANDWLNTRYSFSFSKYRDPMHMGFRNLRVMNEDYIGAGRGFRLHPHDNMEIVTYVLEGALQHEDTLGNGAVIEPGIVQQMSAGTGIRHAETNPSARVDTHLYQIWIVPDVRGVTPSYGEVAIAREGALRLVASGAGGEGAVRIHADADLYNAVLRPGQVVRYEARPGRGTWVQVARGSVSLNGQRLVSGDGAHTDDPGLVEIRGEESAEVLLFDLA
ncbi:MAG: pirin family protein [Deltaproteobacteria bacterium]|nr:MAG: pirin family protein [Deltaproteobacteria bacterium]